MSNEMPNLFTHISTETSADQTMSGHGTSVRRRRATSGGDIVDKNIKQGGAFAGQPEDYLGENKDWLIPAIANFINDMSELRPMYTLQDAVQVPGIHVKDADELGALVAQGNEFLSPRNRELILSVFEYLRDLPENKEYVFAHRDLHGENIILDDSAKRLSVIDFEMAGFESKFASMYAKGVLAQREVWEYANKLPRVTNPNLCWNFDADKFKMLRFLLWAIGEIRYFKRFRPVCDVAEYKEKFEKECDRVRIIMGNLKLKAQQPQDTAALVTQNHYSRDI